MFSFETGLNISSVFCDLEPVTSCDYCALWSSRGLTHVVPSTQQPERCVDGLVWLKVVDIDMTKKESKPRDCATPGVDLNGSDDGSSCNQPLSEEALCGTSLRRCSRLWSSPNCQEKEYIIWSSQGCQEKKIINFIELPRKKKRRFWSSRSCQEKKKKKVNYEVQGAAKARELMGWETKVDLGTSSWLPSSSPSPS